MARKKKHEEHLNHEAWAIPYGDLVTLLFALFTVMYAMSSVNEGKYRVLSDSLVAAFRGTPKTTTPLKLDKSSSGKGGDKQLSGVRPTALMKLRDPLDQKSPNESKGIGTQPQIGQGAGALPQPGQGAADKAQAPNQISLEPVGKGGQGSLGVTGDEAGKGGKGRTTDPGQALFEMADEIKHALQGLIDKRLVRIRQTDLALEVEINTDILFPSGVAQASPAAAPVLARVAEILKPFPNSIRVEGHTDNRPIATAAFPSNWELSAARAANVVQLFSKNGVDPLRMQVLGLGEFHPVSTNDTADGRNANRRVVIVVTQRAPSDKQSDPIDSALKSSGTVRPGSGVTVLVDKPHSGNPNP